MAQLLRGDELRSRLVKLLGSNEGSDEQVVDIENRQYHALQQFRELSDFHRLSLVELAFEYNGVFWTLLDGRWRKLVENLWVLEGGLDLGFRDLIKAIEHVVINAIDNY